MAFWWWIAQHAATTALAILVVLVICRLAPHRPALAHALWVALLLKFVVPPLVNWPWMAPGAKLLNGAAAEKVPLLPARAGDVAALHRAASEQPGALSSEVSASPAWNKSETVVVLEPDGAEATTSGESLQWNRPSQRELRTSSRQMSWRLPIARQRRFPVRGDGTSRPNAQRWSSACFGPAEVCWHCCFKRIG